MSRKGLSYGRSHLPPRAGIGNSRGRSIEKNRECREGIRARRERSGIPARHGARFADSPQVDKLDFNEGQPLKFRAVFEVLPEFELGNYKGLEFEMPTMDITDADVTKTLEEMRERAATFAPVEGRAVEDGDFAQVKLLGTPDGGGDPLQADSVLCHIGAEETMEPFNANLKGASAGDHKNFDVDYPADYPDPKLA